MQLKAGEQMVGNKQHQLGCSFGQTIYMKGKKIAKIPFFLNYRCTWKGEVVVRGRDTLRTPFQLL
jgi:hypothetical protein